jgi:uncharacterized protein YcfL
MKMKKLSIVSIIAAGLLTGCGSTEEVEEEPKKEVVKQEVKETKKKEVVEEEPKVKEAPKKEVVKEEAPKIKKEQYDVVWGTYDKEWVYADSWTGEGFESFDVALKVLDDCSKKTEEATEQCVKDYLMKH